MRKKYATAPAAIEGIPPGIPYIVGNEAAERFSFYGMKAILVIFMTKYLMNSYGQLDTMSDEEAKTVFHFFSAGVYFFPILGALLADVFWGKYHTIIWLSLVYCAGHAALAVNDTRIGLYLGLFLITLGAGGIKSCVSANVGDQFGPSNSHLLSKVFGWFYFSINLGSCASTLLTPWLLNHPDYGPAWAFGVPGVLMGLATLCFWMGRWKYAHIPPAGMKFFEETFSKEGLLAIARLSIIYVFVAVFWTLFDQTASAWVLQAQSMDLNWFGHEWLPSQLQTINPILVMVMIPVFSYVIYPLVGRFVRVTPLRKISVGLFLAAVAFAIPAWLEMRIAAGETPHMVWHFVAYLVMTAAEVMVSITCLEFSYTQAPKKIKSFVMGLYLLSVTLGNVITAAVNFIIQNPDGTSKLEGAAYYWFFVALMFMFAVGFVGVAATYRERTYIQDEEPAT
ncbi:MAG: POT family MFS transporter [Pirellulales bacterium]|nr:POT family MFS transporter [Pirellulales bacterium]